MEVYIYDMLVKSVQAELHITHLAEAFQVLLESPLGSSWVL